jgi:hypothetical protein
MYEYKCPNRARRTRRRASREVVSVVARRAGSGQAARRTVADASSNSSKDGTYILRLPEREGSPVYKTGLILIGE